MLGKLNSESKECGDTRGILTGEWLRRGLHSTEGHSVISSSSRCQNDLIHI